MKRLCACGCGKDLALEWRIGDSSYARGHDPVFRQKCSVASKLVQKEVQNRPEVRAKRSASARKAAALPEVKARRSASQLLAQNSSSTRKKKSVALKAAWADPTSKKRHIEGLKRAWDRPEVRAKHSIASSGLYNRQTSYERLLQDSLDNRIFKYTGLDKKRSYGQPISSDLLAPTPRLIIQHDGCHFHHCPCCFPDRGTRAIAKHAKDRTLIQYAEAKGWVVLRFWSCDLDRDLDGVLAKINSTAARLYLSRLGWCPKTLRPWLEVS